jgi:hypothetical protein
VHPRPHQSSVGVDVNLGDPQPRGRQVLLIVYASRARVQFSARRIDSAHLVFGHTRAAVHDDRRAGQQLLDLADDLEVQTLFTFELVGPVAGADGRRQRIAAGLRDELDGLLRVGRNALPSSTWTSSSTPPNRPSSASTLMPLACARLTTRLVMSTFASKVSWLASIITEL